MNIHDEALAIMDRDGWMQGQMHEKADETGRHCTLGCYEKALLEHGIARYFETPDPNREGAVMLDSNPNYNTHWYPPLRELARVMGWPVDPEESMDNLEGVIASWNDEYVTDPVQIREALKRASELHEQHRQGA